MGPGAGSPSAAQVETAPASPIDLRARFADIESPEHHAAAPGPRPTSVNRQRRYDRVARNIDAFRERFDGNGPDRLGPRPFETFPRLAYNEVVNQIQDYEKMSWRELKRQSPGIETSDLGGQEIVGIDMGLDL